MNSVMQAVKQLHERVEDTYKAVGADAFSEALAVYSYAKMSDPGLAMDTVLKDLARRFTGKRKPGGLSDLLDDGEVEDEMLVGMEDE